MKEKTIILLQSLAILPLVLFIYLFNTADFFVYNLLSILLILILGVNIKNHIHKKKIIKYPIFLLLILSYFFYAFHFLGSKEPPITYNTFNHKGIVASLEFKKPQKIDEICYYFGINKDVKFDLEYQANNTWKKLHSHAEDFPYSFQWRCKKIKLTTVKDIQLKITAGQVMLSELRFRHESKDINFKSSKTLLNDETNIQVSKSYYDGMVFDEIYHGRTAYEIMRDVYPVYENTHPYLGKLLIIPGIKLFGMTPFGWRFSNVIFGAIFIFVAYYFALKLFRDKLYAFVASFLMTYSFMHLTQSRLGLIDTFGVLFVFISYYFLYIFIKKQKLSWLLASGVFFGLAAAVKWSAVFASLGFVFISLYLLITKYPLEKRFSSYRLILYGLLSYGIVALIVYALTFYDIYLKTGSFQEIIEYQVNMFAYHSNLVAEHAYSSAWWSWPFNIKPMCAYRNIKNNVFSSITIFGNPAIFWLGIIAIIYLFYVFIKRKTIEGTFILFAFMSLYLPYIFIGRYMFIYHYYYAVPFLILAIVYGIRDFLNYYPKYSILLWIYLAIVAMLFLEFYPVLSGYEVPKIYVDYYLTWLPSWWF